jgi:hypothetical protein
MKLIGSPNESTVIVEVDLHHTESRRVTWGMKKSDALEKFQFGLSESFPFQFFQMHIMSLVDTMISLGRNSPTGMFELFLVNIDWHIGVNKMLKSTRMIEMKVTYNHCFHIFYIITGGLNCVGKPLRFRVLGSWENIG